MEVGDRERWDIILPSTIAYESKRKSHKEKKKKKIYIYVCVCVYIYIFNVASLVAQLVKNLPAIWETWVQ